MIFKKSKVEKETYLGILKMMYELFQLSQKEGVLALESHIEHPEKSTIFSIFPALLDPRNSEPEEDSAVNHDLSPGGITGSIGSQVNGCAGDFFGFSNPSQRGQLP